MPKHKSAAKHQIILDAAKNKFLSYGFAGSSMSEISAATGMSKSTLYSHFSGKEALFVEVIEQHYEGYVKACTARLHQEDQRDMTVVLTEFAVEVMAFLYKKETLGLFRLLVAESARFPKLSFNTMKQHTFGSKDGKNSMLNYYAKGPAVGPIHHMLREYLHAQTKLSEKDANHASLDFLGLLEFDAFWYVLAGFSRKYTKKEMQAHIDRIVPLFLKMIA
jgi:TetR/AcrR family transcriptional repressor of mexJK operon